MSTSYESTIDYAVRKLIEIEINAYDFGRIIDDAIGEHDDVIAHESRIDDLENIDVESTLTEFGDRIDEIESYNDHGAMQLMVASIAEINRRLSELETRNDTAAPVSDSPIKPVLVRALDRVLPSTDPENSIVRGYDSYSDLEAYARAVIREGNDSAAAMLVAMAFATARNMIDSAAASYHID